MNCVRNSLEGFLYNGFTVMVTVEALGAAFLTFLVTVVEVVALFGRRHHGEK